MVASANSHRYSRLQNPPISSRSPSDSTVRFSTAAEHFYDAVGRSKRRNMGLFVDTTHLDEKGDDTQKSTTGDGDDGSSAPAVASHFVEEQDQLSPSDKTRHLVESFRRRGESFGESSGKSTPTAAIGKNTPTASDRSTPTASDANTPSTLAYKPNVRPMSPVSQGFLGTLQTERQRTEERIQVIKKLRHLKERQAKGLSARQESSTDTEDRFVSFNDIPESTEQEPSTKSDCSTRSQRQFPRTQKTNVTEQDSSPVAQPQPTIKKKIVPVAPQPVTRRRQISPGAIHNSLSHGVTSRPIESGAVKHFEDLYSNPKGVFPAIHSINHANFKSIENPGALADNHEGIKETLTYGQMLRAASRDAADTIVKRPIARQRPPASPKRSVVHMDEGMAKTTTKDLERCDAAQSRGKTSPSLMQQDVRETQTIPPTLDVKPNQDSDLAQSRDETSSKLVQQDSQTIDSREVLPFLQKRSNQSSDEARDPPTLLQTPGLRSLQHSDAHSDATQHSDDKSPTLTHHDSLALDVRESPTFMKNETPTEIKSAQDDLHDSPSPLLHFRDQSEETLAERGRANNFLVELAKAKSEILELQQRLTAADIVSQSYKKDLMKARQVKTPFWKRAVKKKDQKLYGDLGCQTANDSEDLISQLLSVIHTLPICDEISLRIDLANGEAGWELVSAKAENPKAE